MSSITFNAFPIALSGGDYTSPLKNLARRALRAYLTYTPVNIGRYPLMMLCHKYLSSHDYVTIRTKDRGNMVVNLSDEAQFPLYYNNYDGGSSRVLREILKYTTTAIDIGANIGQYSLLFAKTASRVYSFEPMPQKASHCQYHININELQDTIKLLPLALSDRIGSAQFAVPNSHENEGTGSLILEDSHETTLISVATTTLDDFVSERQISKIDLIKIDNEGAELFALKGMEEVLRSHCPMLMLELNTPMMTAAGYTAADVQNYLLGYGYSCFELQRSGLKRIEDIKPGINNYCFLTNKQALRLKAVMA